MRPRFGRRCGHRPMAACTWLACGFGVVGLADARPVGSVVYSQPGARLRFSHERHRQTPCKSCHAGVVRSRKVAQMASPREAQCRGCHGDKTRADDSPNARRRGGRGCAFCHIGYSGTGIPEAIRYSPARLKFSHKLHLSRKLRCASCHSQGRRIAVLPKMQQCMSCHRREKASNACRTCHLVGRDGRLKTHFGVQRLRPTGSLVGAAHGLLFSRRHAAVARSNQRFCDTCHRPEQCLSCHAGSQRPMSIHSGDYLTHHAADARRNDPKCSSCHRSQTFCLSCHQRLGVSRSSADGAFRPTTGRRFHPAGFNSIRPGAGHHRFSARRNIRACASCHQEQTCLTCHSSAKLGGGGFSPHGSRFAGSSKCRSLARRNRRMCLKCHRDDGQINRCR